MGDIKRAFVGFFSFFIKNTALEKEKFLEIDPSRDCKHHCLANEKNKMILRYLDAKTDHMGFV